MRFENIQHLLEDDQKYQDWKKEHPDSFLSYAFLNVAKEITDDWQIGYYDKQTNKITTFTILNQKVEHFQTDDIFKHPDSEVQPLQMEKLKHHLPQTLEKLDLFIKKEYPQEFITKKLIVLQTLPEYGQVWNITCISMTMKSLNVKIDTETGEIKQHKLTNLLDFRSKENF